MRTIHLGILHLEPELLALPDLPQPISIPRRIAVANSNNITLLVTWRSQNQKMLILISYNIWQPRSYTDRLSFLSSSKFGALKHINLTNTTIWQNYQ